MCVCVRYLLVLQRPLKEAQEGGQAEAVHVVDPGQVCDDKIHLTGTLSQGQVGITLLREREGGRVGEREGGIKKERERKNYRVGANRERTEQ